MTLTATGRPADQLRAQLPEPRGPLSAAVIDLLRSPAGTAVPAGLGPDEDDPFGEDLQLALHLCYELHYRSFAGVDDEWEWDPGLLALRRRAEGVFLGALRSATQGGTDVTAELGALLVEPADGDGISHRLRDRGDWTWMREYLVHRSIYHLKEADPHAWAVPRLQGRAKAALVAVEFDEFGGGHARQMHSRLFEDLLTGAGLDPGYLRYLDVVPAPALAVVNMMSLFGLHRSLRGALVGHFAAAEITTGPSARRMAEALRRLGAPEECVRFYTEHIEADAVHEQLMRHDVVADLLDREPSLAADVVLGIQATELLEDRLADHLRSCWDRQVTSLRRPLPPSGR
ncbi:iron-containing redox enzyme family protein [Streptomyces pactum]|uniref:Iron-containing redox enzyme family protein n=1 Tax=Streptomyces pactum TaxID=68249 RepID=A0ABS0NE64_9ACTN|nr:iron-containing redox enzyme family protein [Streptomyces pactum]MBH5333487.1 iron-containing redox enzyme family protein [Streptomyces pactum]